MPNLSRILEQEDPNHLKDHFYVNTVQDVNTLPTNLPNIVLMATYAKFGYGHASRLHKIAKKLCKNESVSPIIISTHKEFFSQSHDSNIRHVFLPRLEYESDIMPHDTPDYDLVSTIPGVSATEMATYKGSLMEAIVKHVKPAVLLIDEFPFPPKSAKAEFSKTFDFLEEQAERIPILSGLRGYLSKEYTQEEQGAIAALADRIDNFFVFIDPREEGELLDKFPFLEHFRDKMQFTGYVCPDSQTAPTKRQEIIATCGGGIDGFHKINSVCEAFEIFSDENKGYTLLVTTGHRFPENAFNKLTSRYSRQDIHITRHLNDLPSRYSGSELVISMGGYNSCTELFTSDVKNIVLPRVTQRDSEQMGEALKFYKYGGIDLVVEPSKITSAYLASEMKRVLFSKRRDKAIIDISGAQKTADLIVERLISK